MSTITVRMNENEKEMFEAFAKLHGVPLSTIMKQALEEKIEDEFDLQVIETYEKGIENDENKLYSHEKVKRSLGL